MVLGVDNATQRARTAALLEDSDEEGEGEPSPMHEADDATNSHGAAEAGDEMQGDAPAPDTTSPAAEGKPSKLIVPFCFALCSAA